jgi:hypothetical protein
MPKSIREVQPGDIFYVYNGSQTVAGPLIMLKDRRVLRVRSLDVQEHLMSASFLNVEVVGNLHSHLDAWQDTLLA